MKRPILLPITLILFIVLGLTACLPPSNPTAIFKVSATFTPQPTSIPTKTPGPAPTSTPYATNGRWINPPKLKPYHVEMTPEFSRDLKSVIEFALENGYAREIIQDDLGHCHVLIDSQLYYQKYALFYTRPTYFGKFSSWMEGIIANYAGLLCHSQEFVKKWDIDHRSQIIWKGKAPFAMAPTDGSLGVNPIDLPGKNLSAMGIEFNLTQTGEKVDFTLYNGDQITVVIKNPSVYLYDANDKLEIDIP